MLSKCSSPLATNRCPISSVATGSLYDIVDGWVNSFYHCATMFKRLDDSEGRYIREMVDDLEVQMLLATLNDVVARAEGSAIEFR